MAPLFPLRTAARVDDVIQEVFLSATVADLEPYRESVQKALSIVQAEVVLQKEWNEGAADVIELCLTRLAETDAYFGVFGFRYGWVPSGSAKSITELEYDHAFSTWKQALPPIFLFVPEEGSEAAIDLSKLADAALVKDYAEDEQLRKESRSRQCDFRKRLTQ